MSHSSSQPTLAPLTDSLGRPLRSLRLSVTDRCNLRCKYCMPEDEYAWLPRETILTFEEMALLTDVFADLGVDRVRLTGGEPLLRRDLPRFVRMLTQNRRITDIALTTNGVLMAEQAEELYYAGLHRVTVSLDTLRADRFRALTKRDLHHQVFDGIKAVVKAGFPSLKFDTVMIKGYNDDELLDLIEYGKTVRAEVRFIEYMDVGGATGWSMDQVLSRDEMLERGWPALWPGFADHRRQFCTCTAFRIARRNDVRNHSLDNDPLLQDGDRSRLTADGMWYLCLYAKAGMDLGCRFGRAQSRKEIAAMITSVWQQRADRGAEERKALERLGLREQRLIEINRLREDPHLEMHARGG